MGHNRNGEKLAKPLEHQPR